MDKHDLLRNSFKKLNSDTSSTDDGPSVPSFASYANDPQQKTGVKNEKFIDRLTFSIEVLARKNLKEASITAADTRNDREERNTALILEIEEKKKDKEQREDNAKKDREYQEKTDLKHRFEDLVTEKREVQQLAAECM